MPVLPPPFPTPDWALSPGHYPAVFVVDVSWAATAKFRVDARSVTTAALSGADPLNTQTVTDNHGEKTLHVILSIAPGLPDQQVTLVSTNRSNQLPKNTIQLQTNLPEALLSIQPKLAAGDLVVINVGVPGNGGQESFARDPLVAQLLRDITDLLGGIVVISAGNTVQPLLPTEVPNVVVVGGVLADGQPASRFGDAVTCYGTVPYNLPNLPGPIPFGLSSGATAYTAGMVLMILNYATSKGLTLTGNQVVTLLKANGRKTPDGQSILGDLGSLPDWNTLQSAIDGLVI